MTFGLNVRGSDWPGTTFFLLECDSVLLAFQRLLARPSRGRIVVEVAATGLGMGSRLHTRHVRGLGEL